MRFEKPSFVLTDRLPSSFVAPLLLGRVVADIKHPTHEYAPKDLRPALQDETIEIVDSNVSSVLSVVKNKIVKAKIADILALTLDDEKEPEVAYGELKLIDFQDSVYGKSEEEKMIFEDDQVDEEEMDDESVEFVPNDVFKEERRGGEDTVLPDE
ncbi:hypothetical protein OEA41_003352 [Lepraria neglecta]|uniref:Uncharacterized protein n=1 Tax=Lepraria neglecta TaxID=209136 RepID=A0AAE0DLD6_9LECA|nr:hypothetical protein OEA41_003352 [Lepraria neglecta]